ncbi:MAG TPA: hypothetical protein VG320_13920, partial [Paraburkholderia sp.]|uniref:hypothetical protein n=1 Tax=Paraburkholderia sp. TaxID=1926495 RepID=UPI002DF17F6B|nr:hypothetical protein [Paraburkholderia sp.]
KNLTYFCVRLLILLPLPTDSEEPVRPHSHQAPTLIGCKFLKIDPRKPPGTSCYPAFFASLRLQQRNEIMKALFRFVNIFFYTTA